MQPPDRIGKRLRMTRVALGYDGKQAEFAGEIGVLPSALSQWELAYQGRIITISAAIRMCERFGVDLDWIYRGDPSGLPQRLAALSRQAT
jgi:transcriptional regulator with XRE-family HTH domain